LVYSDCSITFITRPSEFIVVLFVIFSRKLNIHVVNTIVSVFPGDRFVFIKRKRIIVWEICTTNVKPWLQIRRVRIVTEPVIKAPVYDERLCKPLITDLYARYNGMSYERTVRRVTRKLRNLGGLFREYFIRRRLSRGVITIVTSTPTIVDNGGRWGDDFRLTRIRRK